MFISKKKYQEEVDSAKDLITGYRNRCMRLYSKIFELEVERDNLKGLVEVMDKRNKELEAKLGMEVSNERKV